MHKHVPKMFVRTPLKTVLSRTESRTLASPIKKALGALVSGQLTAKTRDAAKTAVIVPILVLQAGIIMRPKTAAARKESATSSARGIKSFAENRRLSVTSISNARG